MASSIQYLLSVVKENLLFLISDIMESRVENATPYRFQIFRYQGHGTFLFPFKPVAWNLIYTLANFIRVHFPPKREMLIKVKFDYLPMYLNHKKIVVACNIYFSIIFKILSNGTFMYQMGATILQNKKYFIL